MFLKKIELRGFKSFADKTTIAFPAQHKGHVITGVVGPNGSGKSNIADSIRWVLGEQSIKMLRGKKSQDVIFAGTDKKAKLSSAEVFLYLDNSDGAAPVDMSEIVIGRRLFRNGESEYIINHKVAKLSEVNLLLARAHFGHRTYSIIGQGMIDSFITASPGERQELLEEAAGVKEFQMKKQDAINKLSSSLKHLEQVQALLSEIQPRLRSLTRQVKRLERKEVLGKELQGLLKTYYSSKWHSFQDALKELGVKLEKEQKTYQSVKKESDELQAKWQKTALSETVSSSFRRLQDDYEKILNKRNELFEKELAIKNQILAEERIAAHSKGTAVDTSTIKRVAEHLKATKILLERLATVKHMDELAELQQELSATAKATDTLLSVFDKQDNGTSKKATALGKELDALTKQQAALGKELEENQEKINDLKKEEESKNKQIVDLQGLLQKKQQELNIAGGAVNELKIEKARLDAKIEDLVMEFKEEGLSVETIEHTKRQHDADEDTLKQEISRTKHQLELIGGIDDETLDEYHETKKRFDFLTKEVDDSRSAIKSLEKVIVELDEKIHRDFSKAFVEINKLFIKYFKVLFGGGNAQLKKLAPIEQSKGNKSDETSDEEQEGASGEEAEDAEVEFTKKLLGKFSKRSLSGGIDIKATPPGKKLTSINMLSGGEKALTAIALISAIIANRPSPFVILDEVDAALDEANSERYASILADLSTKTQFIVVTHNRATMHQAKILYGISMGADGVSKLLSVDIEEAEKVVKS